MQFEDASSYKSSVIATGLPASPGAAVGQIVFSAEDAEAAHMQGKHVILVSCSLPTPIGRSVSWLIIFLMVEILIQVRNETSPEDVGGMHAAAGILTARGGMTSHAAVVARGWGKCCVSGCSEIRVSDANKVFFY